MKKQIYGFATVAQLINNIPGELSPVCELTTLARTYSLEKGEYVDNVIPGYRLTTFSVKDVATEAEVALVQSEVTQCLQLVRACLVYIQNNIAPIDPQDFHASIQADFYGAVTNLEFGDLVAEGNVPLPQWLAWESVTGEGSIFKVWLSDQAFTEQYPNFHITVVPPIDDVNVLLGDWAEAVLAIEAVLTSEFVNKAQDLKDLNPETAFTVLMVDFVNRSNPSQRKSTNWGTLVYGEAGNDIDSKKDAIIDYLVTTTGRPEEIWELVLPDLFKRTEFVVWPRWDLQSIPNLTELSGLYSSIVDPKESLDFAVAHTPFYLDSFVRGNCNSLPFTYKSVSLLVVNGERNALGRKKLKEVIPDYVPVPTTSLDFARMSLNTQSWVRFMLPVLIQAEKVTNISALPRGMRRKTRGGTLFIASMHRDTNYLVAARKNSMYPV